MTLPSKRETSQNNWLVSLSEGNVIGAGDFIIILGIVEALKTPQPWFLGPSTVEKVLNSAPVTLDGNAGQKVLENTYEMNTK